MVYLYVSKVKDSVVKNQRILSLCFIHPCQNRKLQRHSSMKVGDRFSYHQLWWLSMNYYFCSHKKNNTFLLLFIHQTEFRTALFFFEENFLSWCFLAGRLTRAPSREESEKWRIINKRWRDDHRACCYCCWVLLLAARQWDKLFHSSLRELSVSWWETTFSWLSPTALL